MNTNAITRQARSDGDQTRAAIIEAAGILFGEQGYDRTTGKAICERAQVNMAAINYHFGSRDGLYLAVLKEIHQRMVNINMLRELLDRDLPPAEKLRILIRQISGYVTDRQHWPMRVWLREIANPSSLLPQLVAENLQPKIDLGLELMSEITGLPADSPDLKPLLLGAVAPFMALVVISGSPGHPLQDLRYIDTEQLADQIWRFIMGGLTAAADVIAKPVWE